MPGDEDEDEDQIETVRGAPDRDAQPPKRISPAPPDEDEDEDEG